MTLSPSIDYRMHAIITRGIYIFFTPFLKTISLFSREFFQKVLSLCMVSIPERFVIKSYAFMPMRVVKTAATVFVLKISTVANGLWRIRNFYVELCLDL